MNRLLNFIELSIITIGILILGLTITGRINICIGNADSARSILTVIPQSVGIFGTLFLGSAIFVVGYYANNFAHNVVRFAIKSFVQEVSTWVFGFASLSLFLAGIIGLYQITGDFLLCDFQVRWVDGTLIGLFIVVITGVFLYINLYSHLNINFIIRKLDRTIFKAFKKKRNEVFRKKISIIKDIVIQISSKNPHITPYKEVVEEGLGVYRKLIDQMRENENLFNRDILEVILFDLDAIEKFALDRGDFGLFTNTSINIRYRGWRLYLDRVVKRKA